MKKEKKRKYKINSAKVAGARLVSSKPLSDRQRNMPVEDARGIILKLIEAIKRL